ncbi:hypothetical protein BHE74_00044842 [Ensete ventricosum]|nr:hypothetical protein BHE74_00044842 [Ensete ventricosum]
MHVMLPLRFPNSDIRAKVFVRKISFKLHVMRLNRVEFYCYVFAAKAIRKEGGWPRPGLPQGGGRLRPRPLAGVIARRGGAYGQKHRCQGLPPVGVMPARGQSAKGRPLAGWLPMGKAATACIGAVAAGAVQ